MRTERNRGAFVANPSPEEARQVFASRRLIEPGIAIAAAGRMTSADVAAFKTQLEEEGRFIAERGPTARRSEIKASGDFHLLLASVAGNVILQRFMEELVARSSLVIALYGRSGISSCGHNEHLQILEALKAGNANRASALMLHHIDHIEADLDLRVRSGPALRQALEFEKRSSCPAAIRLDLLPGLRRWTQTVKAENVMCVSRFGGLNRSTGGWR